jgi:predicted HTH transcriptional regulator
VGVYGRDKGEYPKWQKQKAAQIIRKYRISSLLLHLQRKKMITKEELQLLISQGETTTVQFKVRVSDAYKVGIEMVAFSNTEGGLLVIGIDDKTGTIQGLSFEEIRQTNALLVNAASENVKPAIVISTETVNVEGQNVVVARIHKGKDKPYKDNKGIIWVKNGSDKRKVFSNAELRVMMQSCGSLVADKDSVEGTSINDIDTSTLKHFLYERYAGECDDAGITGESLSTHTVEDIVKAIDVNFTIGKLLRNLSLVDDSEQLTLSGLLLLGKSIQRYRPVMTVKCVSFVGNSIGTTEFRDKMPDREIDGNLLHQYKTAMSFIRRNLKTIQIEAEFNSLGRLEIPVDVFVELLTNALIHRDYYQNAPIRLFIFDNRVEICSPGILPDSITTEAIKQGVSKPRNQLLFDNAKYLLPYTGIGSGIIRAMKSYDHISFDNNYTKEEFVVTILRQKDVEGEAINEAINKTDEGIKVTKNQHNSNLFPHDERINEALNEAINADLESLLGYIRAIPMIKREALERMMGKSNATIERYLKVLKEQGLIEYVGSKRTGGYIAIYPSTSTPTPNNAKS